MQLLKRLLAASPALAAALGLSMIAFAAGCEESADDVDDVDGGDTTDVDVTDTDMTDTDAAMPDMDGDGDTELDDAEALVEQANDPDAAPTTQPGG